MPRKPSSAEQKQKTRDEFNRRMRDRNYQSPNGWRKIYKTTYGITKEIWFALLKAQDYRCAICRQLSSKTLQIDHDHSNGRIRGLLCYGCNSLLGFAKDSPRILAAAIVYLEDHGINYLPETDPLI